ncbi:SgcJ/EcaC family oxidoreductase [Actinoplanes sp. GCM10030250]|uniref:SgcJ/EcaC family oxidoreductase n=1 Tax=Actinoplanes sp. GCM10030250 TaxID=3273376 RepID=UPI00361B660E
MPATELSPLGDVLDAWQLAIDAHQPERVAALFTEDAVFQGLRPFSVGRPGVATYYAGQPAGMTVTYRLLETRRLAGDVLLGWATADFTFAGPERAPVPVNLTVVLRRTADGWRIAHYHASPRIE